MIAVVFYAVYSWTRNQFGSNRLAGDGVPEHAFNNAKRVIRFERLVGLFHEESIQDWFLSQRWLIQAINVFYGTAHFVITLGVFLLFYLKRKDVFPQWRNTLAVMTALAIVGFALFPLMPPRLLGAPCSEYGGACIGSGLRPGWDVRLRRHPRRVRRTVVVRLRGDGRHLQPVRAMPSLHIGWATWSAIALWPLLPPLVAARRRARLPADDSLLVIIVTANHYWIDARRRPGHLRCRGRRRLGDPSMEPGPPRIRAGSASASTASPDGADTAEITSLVTAGSFAVALLSLSGARPAAPFDQSATTVDDVLALGSPVVLAHTGGEDRYPGSTMYAFRNSMAAGVDVLDLNVTLTADDVLVVQHDLTVDRTTDGTGTVAEMTYADLADLDNAYWFTPDCGTCTGQPDDAYVHRGVRTGDAPARRVHLRRLRRPDPGRCRRRLPRDPAQRRDQGQRPAGPAHRRRARRRVGRPGPPHAAVVASFEDGVITHVTTIAPDVEVSPGLGPTAAFVVDGTPLPEGQRILQLPPVFDGTDLLTPEIIVPSTTPGTSSGCGPTTGRSRTLRPTPTSSPAAWTASASTIRWPAWPPSRRGPRRPDVNWA